MRNYILKGFKMHNKYAYVICNETRPDYASRVYEVCSTEEKAWQEVEKIYYKHLNFLQSVDDIIVNVKIDNRTITITYISHLTCRASIISIFKRLFVE